MKYQGHDSQARVCKNMESAMIRFPEGFYASDRRAIEAALESAGVVLKTSDVFTFDEDQRHCAVSGNASHGYLYAAFWRE